MKVVRPAPLPSRREVVAQLAKNVSALDETATPIEAEVAVPAGTPIDLIAKDERGNLLIVDVFDGREPAWIAHVLHHMHWLEENRSAFSRSGASVRAIAVVTTVSPPAMNALEFLKGVSLECYVVRCYAHGEERFLALEKRNSRAKRHDKKPSAIKPVELTEDEIADFLEDGRTGSQAGQPFI
jgi:hypothetical protein